MFWWIWHKYCFFFSFTIHGRHLELWSGVRPLYFNRPLSLLTKHVSFSFIAGVLIGWLGSCCTWTFSSIPVGGGPFSKILVPDPLSCTQHCPILPVKGEGSGPVSSPVLTGGSSTWKAVKRCKDCWAEQIKGKICIVQKFSRKLPPADGRVCGQTISFSYLNAWLALGRLEAQIKSKVSFLDWE